jgi:hypothetical protein
VLSSSARSVLLRYEYRIVPYYRRVFLDQDASAAASLIHTIHSSPARLFLGRFLRYEPARAFRTLLISYRLVP